MYNIVNPEIETALEKKGYKWEEITIKPYLGYGHLYGITLDKKFVEVYDVRKKAFID